MLIKDNEGKQQRCKAEVNSKKRNILTCLNNVKSRRKLLLLYLYNLLFFLATFVVSKRGNRMVLYDGYTFTEMKEPHTRTVRWTCSNRKKYRCTAKLRTLEGYIIAVDSVHNHPRRNYPNYEYEIDNN